MPTPKQINEYTLAVALAATDHLLVQQLDGVTRRTNPSQIIDIVQSPPDASEDLGTASNRYRDLYLSRRVTFSNAGGPPTTVGQLQRNGNELQYNDGISVQILGVPTGLGPLPWPVATPPPGWLLCDGAAISRTTYAALFAVIGTLYGAGDGSTTFNLPNMQGRVPVGQDTSQPEFDSLGEIGGAKTHTLSVAEMPSHGHSITDPGHNHGVNDPGHGHSVNDTLHAHSLTLGFSNDGGGSTNYWAGNDSLGVRSPFTDPSSAGVSVNGSPTGVSLDANVAGITQPTPTGGGSAHNNLQPYIVLNYIIKA